jgi:glutathione synthase/RimK-type ligase-like ATP-grasp enzyme
MILCITHSRDFYTVDIVQQALEQAGIRALRFNSDEFALHWRHNYSLKDGRPEQYLMADGKKISSRDIQGVWYRKLWKLQLPPDLDPAYQQVFLQEYQTFLHIFFNSLRHLPWMNDMQRDHAVNDDKFLQLAMADAAGLQVPRSVFTNEPDAIRELFEASNGNIIVKLHGALSRSMEGNTPFFPTTRLQAGDLDRLDQLAYCPMIFQEYVPKAYELRVVYVDGDFFAGKIPHEEELTDWRVTTGKRLDWQHYELPHDTRQKITRLMNSLGLLFGAIDIIRRTDGEYVFLEVNPQGEWGMLQKYLNYPIGQTIAKKLITRIQNA